MNDLATQSLDLVSHELAATLDSAREQLESFVDGQVGPEGLMRCAELLHLAAGALKIVEAHGAALLAEEMQEACHFLGAVKDQEALDDGIETLTRSMVQLPAYIDRLLAGGRDVALILLPLINDLRELTKRPTLSEGTLVLLSSGSRGRFVVAAATAEPATVATDETDRAALAALRPLLQAALLGWIRGDASGRQLAQLIDVSRQLERSVKTEAGRQLWYVLTAVLEAVRNEGLEETVALKRLVGQADRQLKRLIDDGEQAFVAAPPVDLLNGLLYYVGRASGDDERLAELRRSYDLDELVPAADQLAEARNELAGPNAKLMGTVADAIRDDLGSVKDALDIFVRTGMEDTADLAPQLEMLKKIGDTLGVLGLAEPRDAIREQSKRLKSIVAAGSVAEPAALDEIAATLLSVEDVLEKELVDAIAPVARASEPEESEADENYKRVTKTALGECIVNLSHVKETIVHLLDEPADLRMLDQIGPQLQGINAGLLMLGKSRAVAVVERIGAVIRRRMGGDGAALDAAELERLADAIVSLEYYMETVATGRSDPGYMLDNAERCLDVIEREAPEPVGETPIEPPEDRAPEVDEAQTIVAAALPEAREQRPPAVMQMGEDRPDPELVELFIEEAKEELAEIKRLLPQWRDDPEQRDALVAVRRSFHTLKGSGRVVGAELIGEFCWSVEKILNRVINRTLPVTEAMLALLDDAIDALPKLIEQLEFGTRPRVDVQRLMDIAESIAAAGSEAVLANETMQMQVLEGPELAQSTPEPAEPDTSMDPVLAEIFAKESRGHLNDIRDYLAEVESGSAPYPVDDTLFRAAHTLLGSANMAAFAPLVTVVEPLDAYIGAQIKSKSGISEDGLKTVKRAVAVMEDMIAALEANETFSEETAELAAALRALAQAAEPAEPAREAAASESAAEGSAAKARDFDPEIAAIFSEEASEILDSAELALQDFRRDARRTDQLAELQRLLHTLKGGARMAGLPVMGELSHSLEDLLSGMASGRLAPNDEAIDVVQQSVDHLHQMRDAIASGREEAVPETLLARIVAVARVAPGEVDEPPTAPESAAAEAPRADEDGDEDWIPEPGGIELEEVSFDDIETVIEAAPDFEAQGDDDIATDIGIAPDIDALGTLTLSPDDLATFEMLADRPLASDDSAAPIAERDATAAAPVRADDAEEVAQAPAPTAELVRVDAELLDALLNGIGEVSIFQSRLAQQANYLEFNLGELDETVVRLREQLRQFEAETEAQILHRHHGDAEARGDFDPLELDRYSKIQQLSRALAETANDVASINDLLRGLSNETTTLLTQQARVAATVQDGLMQTRMVPFERYVPRLARIVRQACADTGKTAELEIDGAYGELDRQVIEQMLAPLEHLLRNAVVHGIEPEADRRAHGKPAVGHIDLGLKREGSEVIIQVADDGAGLDLEAILSKARELDLLPAGTTLAEQDVMELILRPGFSTAGEVTQAAGRGVGLDVVDNQIKKLGGSLRIESKTGSGTRFILRLPYTLAVTHALIVNVGEETFALPLPTVEGITRVPKDRLLELLTEDEPVLEHGGIEYRLQHLGSFVGAAPSSLSDDDAFVSLVLVRAGDSSTALLTDSLEGSREVVVKTLGPHLTGIPGVSGATILGDGRIIVILDVGTLIRAHKDGVEPEPPAVPAQATEQTTALVVDDSITMRRVTQRLLERHGARVLTARDGMDAITVLQDQVPDIILLDIEMPRMDGYQFATYVRKHAELGDVPIIMITSRAGEKHRARAIEIGVNDYLSKPYQEEQLIGAIESLLGRAL